MINYDDFKKFCDKNFFYLPEDEPLKAVKSNPLFCQEIELDGVSMQFKVTHKNAFSGVIQNMALSMCPTYELMERHLNECLKRTFKYFHS